MGNRGIKIENPWKTEETPTRNLWASKMQHTGQVEWSQIFGIKRHCKQLYMFEWLNDSQLYTFQKKIKTLFYIYTFIRPLHFSKYCLGQMALTPLSHHYKCWTTGTLYYALAQHMLCFRLLLSWQTEEL